MTIQVINTGTGPNSGNGDSIRTAFSKVNANFAELATLATGTNFDLLAISSSIIPATDQNYSLGSASDQWENLYLGPNGVTIDGNELTIDGSGNITVNGTPFQSGFASTSSLINGPVQVQLDNEGSLNFPPNGVLQSYISSSTTATIFLIDDITLDSPVMIHTIGPHDLSNSDLVKLTGIGTTIELNNKYHYVSVVNTTTVDLYEDAALSIPVDGTGYTPFLGLSNSETFTNTGTTGRSNVISQFLDVYPDIVNIRVNWYASGSGIDQPDPDNTTYTVIKQPGFLAYLVDGVVNKPLYLQRGNTYYLDVFSPPHPVYIQTTGAGYNPADVYSLGVTNQGTGEGIITFTVPLNAPDTLYYQCRHHAEGVGPIYISDGVGKSKVLAVNTQTTSSRVLYQFILENTWPLVNQASYAFTGTFEGGGQLEFQDVEARLTVKSNEQTWIFNPTGVLTLPPEGDIQRNGLSVLNSLKGRTFVVTEDGPGEHYVFDGTPSSPDIVLIRGLTYYFEANVPGHPFWIQSTPGAFDINSVLTNGIINNGVEVGTLTFTVPEDAPDTLYYACEYDSIDTGQFLIRNLGDELDLTQIHTDVTPDTQYTHDLGSTSSHWRNIYARTGFFGEIPSWIAVNPLSVFTANVDGYTQIQAQNLSTGTSASTDFVATADSGDDETDYINFGINGSNYVNEDWTVSGGRDGYLYVSGNNLTIGTDSSGTTVKIHIGGTLEENLVAIFDSTGLMPAANLTYDLGSTSSQWRSIHVGTGTIYIGGVALGVSENNYVTVNGNPIITVSTAGTLTVQGNTDLVLGSVSVSDTAPAATTEGSQWYNTVDGRTYIAYGEQWVDANPTQIPSPETYLDGLAIDGTIISTANVDSDAIVVDGGNNTKLTVSNNSVTIQVPGSEIRPYWAAEFGGITTAVTTSSAAFGTGAFYDSLGNVYVLGAVNYGDGGPGAIDSLLLKYDTNGNLLWSKTWHDDSGANCGAVNQAFAIDSNDRIYWLATTSAGGFGCWSGYMDTDGNLGLGGIAQNSLGFVDGSLHASDIACDNSGNYYLAGSHYDDISYSITPVVIKIDGDSGTPIWTGNIIPEDFEDLPVNGVYRAVTVNPATGDVWAIGDYDDGGLRAVLSKWDVNGVHQWTKELVTTTGDLASAVIYNGGYVYTIVNDDPDAKAVVSKFDTDGVMIWASYLAVGALDPITNGDPFTNTGAYDLSFDASGNVYVTGTIPGPPVGSSQLWITKLDPADGEMLYSRILITTEGSTIGDYSFFGNSIGHRVGDIYEDKLVVTAITNSDIDDSTSTQALRVITAQLPIDGSVTGTFDNIDIVDVTSELDSISSTGTYTVTTLVWSTGTATTLISTSSISVSTVTDIVGLTGETIALGSVSGSSTTTNTWTFVNNNIILPPGGDILDSNGVSVLGATTSTTANGWQLTSSTSVVSLGSNGILTLPNGGTIADDTGAIRLTPPGATSATQLLSIYPTVQDGNHIHLTADGGETDLYLGNDSQFVKVDHSGDIVVQTYSTATTSTWTFGTDGGLTLPNGATIVDTTSTLVLTPNSPAQVTSLVLRSTYNSYMTADYPTDQGYQQYLHELDPVTYPDPYVSTGTEGTVISITLWDASGLQYVQGDVEYIITGTGITAADFTPAVLTGTFAAANWTLDGGGFNYTNTNMLMIANDAIVEGEETFTVTIITTGTYAPGAGSNYLRVNIVDGTTEGSESGHIHLISENMAQTSIFLGNDDKYVKVAADDQIYIKVPNVDTSGTSQLWTFGTDGSTTLPIGVSIDESSGSHFPRIIADSGKAFSLQGQGSTGSAAIAWLDYESTSSQYAAVGVNGTGTDNLAKVVLTAGSSTPTLKVWRFDETGVITFPDNTVQTTAYVPATASASTYTGWFKAAGTVVQLDTLLARINSTGTMQISSTIVETIGQGSAFAWNGIRNKGATMSSFGQGGTNWVNPGDWLDISATPLDNDFEVATVSVFKLGGTGSLYRITYVGSTNSGWAVNIERVAQG